MDVFTDGRDRAHDRGALAVDRFLFGDFTELFGISEAFRANLEGLILRLADNDGAFHFGAELHFPLLLNLGGGDFEFFLGENAESKRRPNDVRAILLDRHATFVLDQLDILIHGDAKLVRHPRDFFIDVLFADDDFRA